MSEFDYQRLLILYIDHVGECEGVTFLGGGWRPNHISEAEWKELQRLRDLSKDGLPERYSQWRERE